MRVGREVGSGESIFVVLFTEEEVALFTQIAVNIRRGK